MGNKATAKTLAEMVTAKVTKVFNTGFNCTLTLQGKDIKTFSTFSMLGKNGDQLLNQTDIVFGKELMITKLLENLTPGKDPIATGVVGVPAPQIAHLEETIICYYEDSEDELEELLCSKSKNHGKYGKQNRRFDKKNNIESSSKRKDKIKGGANSRRFDDYFEEYC